MYRIKAFAGGVLAFLMMNFGTLSVAQVGWSVSNIIVVPRTDYSVTGPEPYSCLSAEEAAQLQQDPVHIFQLWLARWLETTFDYVARTQTYDNCAQACAAVPLDAEVITRLQGYIRDLPTGPFVGLPWPNAGAWAGWEEEVDSSKVEHDKRFVCATLHNWVHSIDRQAYFVVYFER